MGHVFAGATRLAAAMALLGAVAVSTEAQADKILLGLGDIESVETLNLMIASVFLFASG